MRNAIRQTPEQVTDTAALPRTRNQEASIGLVTLNSRFVHVALSVRYLRNAARRAGFTNVWIQEFTLQTPLWKLASTIMVRRPAVLGFSVYIWNREETLALIERLKKQDPGLCIVIGGPEVSFEPSPPPYVDVVIAGEGETKWVRFLEHWAAGGTPNPALLARWNTYGNELPPLEDPPFVEEDLVDLQHRLVYLETSRGCPFACAFCLSSLDRKVRFFPEAVVRTTLERLAAAGARRIKFLDRTFNLGRERVLKLFEWLSGFEGMEFHFEVVADLLDEPLLRVLEKAPAGMFQFEIGIQSAHPDTQRRVARRQNPQRLFQVIRRLRQADRVHLHVDLIWGLPGETLEDIRTSFEQVLALRPHQLQLGFLKFLPGAPIRSRIEPDGYVFQERPPYEIIGNRHLPAQTVLALKRFEEVFDLYYNSGRYRFTLERLFQRMPPWDLFQGLADYFVRHDLIVKSHGLDSLTRYLLECAADWLPGYELIDLLKLDYCYHHRTRQVPGFLKRPAVPESTSARARRKSDPDCAVVAFQHRIVLDTGGVSLEPSAEPVWYAISYPKQATGYFFRPSLTPLG